MSLENNEVSVAFQSSAVDSGKGNDSMMALETEGRASYV